MKSATRLLPNIDSEKPLIPELPKSKKKLEALLRKKFKVLGEGEIVSADGGVYHPGGVAINNIDLECPFCGMKFIAVQQSGCFMHRIIPDTCPNCNFPINVWQALKKLLDKKRE